MVPDGADVPVGPASLDSVRVEFNEERLVSDAGLLIAATLAERLGIEETVNESVWLDPRAPGAGWRPTFRVIASGRSSAVW